MCNGVLQRLGSFGGLPFFLLLNKCFRCLDLCFNQIGLSSILQRSFIALLGLLVLFFTKQIGRLPRPVLGQADFCDGVGGIFHQHFFPGRHGLRPVVVREGRAGVVAELDQLLAEGDPAQRVGVFFVCGYFEAVAVLPQGVGVVALREVSVAPLFVTFIFLIKRPVLRKYPGRKYPGRMYPGRRVPPRPPLP